MRQYKCILVVITLYVLSSVSIMASSSHYAYQVVGADTAKTLEITGANIKVAIIDTGVNLEDLNEAQVKQYSLVGDDGHDTYGHGTIIAGLIAGICQNNKGVDGIAPEAEIISIKIFNKYQQTTYEKIAEAIELAIKEKCQVINISFGTTHNVPCIEQALEQALKENIIIVASAGNMGNTKTYYPAAYKEVIGVGAVDNHKVITRLSQRNKAHEDQTFVVAPGVDIYNGGYLQSPDFGTSFSCAFVSGAAVLAKSQNPELTPEQFKEMLIKSSEDLGEKGFDRVYGHGLLRIDTLLNNQALQSIDGK